MNTHKCKEMPGDLYIKYSKWAGGWTIYSKKMNDAIMWTKIRYCPYCGECLDEMGVQTSF